MFQASDVRRAAMDLLARREHSVKELEDKLLARFLRYQKRHSHLEHSASDTAAECTLQIDDIGEIIIEQIEKLRDEGLQSDARMAEAYLRARSNRGHGPQKIAMELRNKGVGESIVDQSFSESGIDWVEKIKAVSAKKYGEMPFDKTLNKTFDKTADSTLKNRMKAKRNRFLLQRGFSYELIAHLDD